MPVFKIQHVTKYTYNRPVKESVNQLRIYPVASTQQEILQHEVSISTDPELFFFIDYWGNRCADFSLLEAHTSLVIDSRVMVRTLGSENITQVNSTKEELQELVSNDFQLLELSRAEEIKSTKAINDIIEQLNCSQQLVMQIVEACSAYIFSEFKYIKGITNIETTVDEILDHRSGVCQDFAHVLLQLLRTMGIPARYVSGYICPNKNGMRGEGATHAWVEAYIPQYGWAGIDPTNNVWATAHHVKLAVGRNFNDCSPVKGTFKGISRQTLSVYVSVGYEDGHMFEEVNDVQMIVSETDKEAERQLAEAEEQQQQQQQ
ncbi:transglutaminase family protein [Lacibacter luteus]|uniref:Transglutaminase family protein n=1 Tax=Lacibacter luteus TaxID=2508719 RepID=A0A4Q1CLI8_9BACT|nr:transglutaminase family protein [Lacibacter luteus]RXK61501.1 transglutaminase family protein [Lacibacter luteus]